MGYQIKMNGNDLGDYHPFVLPGCWQLVPGSTIEGMFADGLGGIFTVLKANSKGSWLMSWSCAGSVQDGRCFELIKTFSTFAARPELADWNAEIVPARTAARAAWQTAKEGRIMTPEDTEDDGMFIPWSEFQSLTKVYNDFDTPRTLKPLDWLKLQGTPAEMFTVTGEGAAQVVMADGRVWIEYQKHVYKALGDDAKAKATL